MYGVPLDAGLIAAAVLAIFLASMTVAPVPSASIVSMAPALDVVGVPLAGLGILLGIDRVPDVFRSATNVIGHMAAATTVDGMTKGRGLEGAGVRGRSAGPGPMGQAGIRLAARSILPHAPPRLLSGASCRNV